MGQEKIRKKNGTYPTPEQIAYMAEYDRRINTSLWYPKASDLSLPYVPEQRTLIMSEQLFCKERSDDESFLSEHLHIEHQPEPKDYGQPTGNYITNRAAYHAWMESSEQDRWSAAHDKSNPPPTV